MTKGDGLPLGPHEHTESEVKKVPARADPGRGEHTAPAPGPLGPLGPCHAGTSERPPAQVVISCGKQSYQLGVKRGSLPCLTGRVLHCVHEQKKKSSFHARAVTRICKISGRHTYGHTASLAGPSKLIIQEKPWSNTNSKHKSPSRLHTTWKY